MYKVTIINDGVKTVVHSPNINNLKLNTGSIKHEINKIDSFNMSFSLNNPAHGKLKPFKTFVKVFNTKTNKYEFEGRVLAPTKTMSEDGLYDEAYECEGELGYLHDSQQRHLEYRGTPRNLFTTLLNYHNEQVEDYKRFVPGIMEVTTSTDNIYIYLSAEKTTFEEIDDKILTRVGGELRIRKENGIRYLDVLERVGLQKQTPIKIAKNLKSISQSVDPTEIITRLTPLGERIESEDEDATDASQARLTIKDVNNGIPYIDRPDLIAEFGIVGGSMTWDDVTLPNRLLSTGRKWMDEQKIALYQYELTALDLSLIGLDIDNFDIGNSHPVINPIMNIDERLRIVGKTTNINSPHDASLKIGDKFKNLYEYQVDANQSTRKIVNLENDLTRERKRVREVSAAVKNAQVEIERLQTIIESANVEELEQVIIDINNQLGSLFDNLGDIGQEILNLQTAIDTFDQFVDQQEQINQEQILQNEDFEQRLLDLEIEEEGDD